MRVSSLILGWFSFQQIRVKRGKQQSLQLHAWKEWREVITGYEGSLKAFRETREETILGEIVKNCSSFNVVRTQRDAWAAEVRFLKGILSGDEIADEGRIYFEYKILGMSKWADVIMLIEGVVFVVEFKVRSLKVAKRNAFLSEDIDQVVDYACDLSNFNSESHKCPIVPILIDTSAKRVKTSLEELDGNVYSAFKCIDLADVRAAIKESLKGVPQENRITDYDRWENAAYSPTPTILDVVENTWSANDDTEMLRSGIGDQGVKNAVDCINGIIDQAKINNEKVLCIVTGVPGAGKTLVGLKIAGHRMADDERRSFVTGNYPLINVLRTKWIRAAKKAIGLYRKRVIEQGTLDDDWRQIFIKVGLKPNEEGVEGSKKKYSIHGNINERMLCSLASAMLKPVKTFREAYSSVSKVPPNQHVVVFDEAQRAWVESESSGNKGMSEPEEILSYMDYHKPVGQKNGWCVLVALVGTGQAIHKKEADISSWYSAFMSNELRKQRFADWKIYVPDNDKSLAFETLKKEVEERLHMDKRLHLNTPMRSFRAKMLSDFVDALLDGGIGVNRARECLSMLQEEENGRTRFKLYITRNLDDAKRTVRGMVKGKRRCGMLASSKGKRLRKFGVFIPNKDFNEVTWFLNDNKSIESSSALEVAGSEFKVQGLEVDYALLAWDGDLKYDVDTQAFKCCSFKSSERRWVPVAGSTKDIREKHLVNSYRVLLTRAREGMVIYVPPGIVGDPTADPKWYDPIYAYLHETIGIPDLADVVRSAVL